MTRVHLGLIGLGLLAEATYVIAFLVPFPLLRYYRVDIDMGQITGHSGEGFATFVSAFTLLFVLLGLGLVLCQKRTDRTTLAILLLFGVVFALTMSFVYPVTAIDLFTYVAQSRILVHYHQNPVFVPPSRFPNDPIMGLSGGWSSSTAPYGPVGLLIDALPSTVAGANLLLNIILLKLMFSAFLIAEAIVVYKTVLHISPQKALAATMLIAWNPLLLFEISANGHNDIVMALIASCSLLAMIRGELGSGLVLGVTAGLVKYASLVLLPLFVVHAATRPISMRRRVTSIVGGLILALLLTILLYAPFWRGTSTLDRSLLENQFHLQSFGSALSQLFPGLTLNGATLLGRILFVPVYAYSLWLSSRRAQDLARACFLALFLFLGLAVANVKIWYAVWPTPFSACLGRVEWLSLALLGYGASMSAVLFGYIYLWLGQSASAFNFVNASAYFLTFVPAALVVLVWSLPSVVGPRRVNQQNASIPSGATSI